MFSIHFLEHRPPRMVFVKGASYAQIVLGDFRETFLCYHAFWRRGDYERQWRNGLRKICGHDRTSALVTVMYPPSKGGCFIWWPMYKQGREVLFQNHLMQFDKLDSPFDPRNPYPHIPEFKEENEAGQKISTWSVPLDEIKHFYRRMQSQQQTDRRDAPRRPFPPRRR